MELEERAIGAAIAWWRSGYTAIGRRIGKKSKPCFRRRPKRREANANREELKPYMRSRNSNANWKKATMSRGTASGQAWPSALNFGRHGHLPIQLCCSFRF